MDETTSVGRKAGRRRIRMTRAAGQSLVVSRVYGAGMDEHEGVEIRVSEVCAGGVTILDMLVPEDIFVERKETLDGVRALFTKDTNAGAESEANPS